MRLRAAPVPLAAALLLAGCTSDEDPGTLPSLTATPTPAPTVTIPAAATPNTSQALDAFVRFYMTQLNAAFSSGDSSTLRMLSDPACATCNNYAKSLDEDANHILGDSFADVEVAAPPVQPSGTIVEVVGRIPSRRVVDDSGSVVRELPDGGRFHFQLNVIRRGDGWLVRGIRKADS